MRGVSVGGSVRRGVGVGVGGSVCFLHSLYTKAFQQDWGGSCKKLHEHAALLHVTTMAVMGRKYRSYDT